MANRTFSVRLSVEDEAKFRKSLEDAGQKGSASLKRIKDSAEPASRGLRALDGSARVAGAGVDSLAARSGTLGGILRGFGPGGLFVAAAVGGFAALALAARNAMAAIAAIGDAADRAQIDAGVFEILQAGLIQTGQKTEGLEASLSRFSRALGEAQAGIGEGGKTFENLGVSIANADGTLRTSEEVLRDVADAFADIQSPAERARVAAKLFEEGGRALIPLLSQGSRGMDELAREAEKLGLVFGGDTIRKAQELNAEFDKQWKIIDTQLKSVFIEFAPLVLALGDAFVFLAKNARAAFEILSSFGQTFRNVGITSSLQDATEKLRSDVAANTEAQQEAVRAGNEGEVFRLKQEAQSLEALRQRLLTVTTRLKEDGGANPLVDIPADSTVPLAPTASPKPTTPGGGGKTPAREAVDEFLRRSNQMQAQIEALRRVVEGTPEELGALFLGNDDAALKGYEAQLKILGEIYEARLAGIELTPEEIASIEQRAQITGQMVAEDERALKVMQDRRAEQKAATEEAARQAAAQQQYFQEQLTGLGRLLVGLDEGADAWKRFAAGIAEAALQAALFNEGPLKGLFGGTTGPSGGGIGGILSGVGNFFGSLFNANGNAFNAGRVVPFATGGIVTGPTMFPMAGSRTGIMGEAGPEAIMPLTRLPGGKLGVQSMGGGGGTVINYAPVINAEAGADVATIEALLARQYQQFRAEVPSIVDNRYAENRRSGARL